MCRNRIHKRGSDSETRTCNYKSLDDCPYNIPKDCKFNQEKCLHEKKKSHEFSFDAPKSRLIICGLIALVLYLCIELYEEKLGQCILYGKNICDILSTMSISVIAGVILTFVIDLPTRLKDYEKSFVHALSSNAYLKTLDEQKLTKLRNDVTEQLHKANAPRMANGLIVMDQRVCDLLRMPYYTRYRHSVICEKPDDNGFITKNHTIEYELINPYGVNKEGKELLQMTNLVKLSNPNDEKERKDVLTILEFTCVVDDDKVRNIVSESEVCYSPIEKKDDYYNTKVYLRAKKTQDNATEEELALGVLVTFKDNIRVRIRYSIKVNKEDRCFSKRLQHPARNFRLDYSTKSEDGKLCGQIFGTEMKQSDISIRFVSDNSISLECFDWLLPQNGAIVVML